MSRVIKFRAWNRTYNWMEDHFYVGAHDGSAYDKPSRTFDTPNIEIDEFPDYELMQFTGLTDKNGVEIYEGDIVKSLGVSDYCFGVSSVIFDNGCFKVLGYGLFGGLVEVIGNIHQNPELLK